MRNPIVMIIHYIIIENGRKNDRKKERKYIYLYI